MWSAFVGVYHSVNWKNSRWNVKRRGKYLGIDCSSSRNVSCNGSHFFFRKFVPEKAWQRRIIRILCKFCQFCTGASRVFWSVCSACGLKCTQRLPVQYISSLYLSMCEITLFSMDHFHGNIIPAFRMPRLSWESTSVALFQKPDGFSIKNT